VVGVGVVDAGGGDVEELVVVHLTMHGLRVASTMPLLAEPTPTGNAVAWDFIHLWWVADGSIVEHWACRDDVGLLAQAGRRLAAVPLVRKVCAALDTGGRTPMAAGTRT
jgi:hypothetical protein